MINDSYALKKWTHRISFFYCAVPLGHFCHVPWDFLWKFSMVCRELLFRNLLDQIWSQTDASCGCDPSVHPFTDSEHRPSTLDIPWTLSCSSNSISRFQTLQPWAQYWLLFRAGSVSPSPSCSCILSGLCCTMEQARGTLRNPNNARNEPFLCRPCQISIWIIGILPSPTLPAVACFYPLQTTQSHLPSLWSLGLLGVASQGGKG